MRINSMEREAKDPKSNPFVYIVTVMLALIVGWILIFLFDLGVRIYHLGVKYGVYVLGGLILLLVLRKLLSRKKARHIEYENP